MPTENEEQDIFRNRERIVCDVISDLERDSAIPNGGKYAPAISLKGALTFALDESPKGEGEKGRMTLAEHDKRHHPNGFNPQTDKCTFRNALDVQIEQEDDIESIVPKGGRGKEAEDASLNKGAKASGWGTGEKEKLQAAANLLKNMLKGVKVRISDKAYQDGGEDSRKAIRGIYTGSIADYEKPSLYAVGTGEGTQVYGYGLYGSTLRNDAEYYAAKAQANYVPGRGNDGRQRIYEQTFFTNRPEGDESHILMWYEPVSDANKKRVDDALIAISGNSMDWSDVETGQDLYRKLATFASPKEASEFLAYNADIDGVKYPAEDHQGRMIGTEKGWDYVSFRDDNITVDRKWVNDDSRFFKSSSGEVVGEYNRKTNEVTLYPGAQVSDVVHEFSHGLWQFAEQEAEAGRGELFDSIRSIAEAAPQAVKDSVAGIYAEQGPSVILEECFTHELARRSNEAFAKAIETDEGKAWYKKAWGAIKSIWKSFASGAGMNKASLEGIDKMSPEEAAHHILSEMAKGKAFGEVRGAEAGDGNRLSQKKSGISNKESKKIGMILAKKRPDLDADLIMSELTKIDDRVLRGDALFWITKGAIRLPEDMYKVEQARELASKAKKDPRQYATPQACINALQKSGHKLKEKPISVEELKKNPLMRDYRNEGYGVESFEVDDSRDGQTLMRKVIDTHWGEDANPWCLLARTHNTPEHYTDEFYDWVNEERAAGRVGYYDSIYTTVAERYEKETGKSALNQSVPNLDSAWDYWNTYNALPKRVAFKDGKLLAFMATDGRGEYSPEAMKHRQEYLESEDHKKYDMSFQNWLWNNYPDVNIIGEEWWDRNDEPHAGIPIGETEIEGDELGRKVDAMLVAGEVVPSKNANAFKKVDGNTYTWYGVSDQMFAEDMADGTRRKWDRDGDLMSEIHSDGTEIHYHNGHKAIERWVDGTEKQYDEKGQLFSISYPDGRFEVLD